MNLPKAKEVLGNYANNEGSFDTQDLEEAARLGSEAIDRLQELRTHPRLYHVEPLPSETE